MIAISEELGQLNQLKKIGLEMEGEFYQEKVSKLSDKASHVYQDDILAAYVERKDFETAQKIARRYEAVAANLERGEF